MKGTEREGDEINENMGMAFGGVWQYEDMNRQRDG